MLKVMYKLGKATEYVPGYFIGLFGEGNDSWALVTDKDGVPNLIHRALIRENIRFITPEIDRRLDCPWKEF